MTIIKNVKITNQDTGEVFWGDDPYSLMEKLGKKFPGGHFSVTTLKPELQFLMK
jgi:hypothetical protein